MSETTTQRPDVTEADVQAAVDALSTDGWRAARYARRGGSGCVISSRSTTHTPIAL